MAEQQTNGNALYKEISAIFAGVSFIKRARLGVATENTKSTEIKKCSNSSTSSVPSVAKSATVAQLVALQAALVPQDKPKHKTIRSKQIGLAPLVSVFSLVFRRMPSSRSRRERKRLQSISEHLLINIRR
jgi:hypothetical protein